MVFDSILYIVSVVAHIIFLFFTIKRTLASLIAYTAVNEFKHIYVVLVPKFLYANLRVMVSEGDA